MFSKILGLEITRIHLDSHLGTLDSLGRTGTHLYSLELTWIHLDSLAFTWTRLDSD